MLNNAGDNFACGYCGCPENPVSKKKMISDVYKEHVYDIDLTDFPELCTTCWEMFKQEILKIAKEALQHS